MAPPTVGVGVDRFGTYIGGGTALYWSDLLGDHTLVTGLQVNGGLRDVAALVGYTNQRHRLNWGLVAQQFPYLTGAYAAGFAQVGNQTAYIEQVDVLRQTNRAVAGLLAYPFSRTQRVEASLGYQNLSFDRERETRAVSITTGQLLFDSVETLPSPNALNLGVANLAFVSDNSFFGATSPILGQRYRVDVSPLLGSLTTTTIIADYRRYVMPVRPWTLAGRLVHVGRYGPDAGDQRLTPLFLGYPELVRGYNTGSFDPTECPSDPNAGCPAFDRLLGSRILVANAELRFPLFGVLGAGRGYYGALPVEAAFFVDAGVAWNQGEQPRLFGGTRPAVSSAGAALRMNLFGFAIGELDLVRPFQRPDKGWYVQLSLTPGF